VGLIAAAAVKILLPQHRPGEEESPLDVAEEVAETLARAPSPKASDMPRRHEFRFWSPILGCAAARISWLSRHRRLVGRATRERERNISRSSPLMCPAASIASGGARRARRSKTLLREDWIMEKSSSVTTREPQPPRAASRRTRPAALVQGSIRLRRRSGLRQTPLPLEPLPSLRRVACPPMSSAISR
jgi:hypothetical protein